MEGIIRNIHQYVVEATGISTLDLPKADSQFLTRDLTFFLFQKTKKGDIAIPVEEIYKKLEEYLKVKPNPLILKTELIRGFMNVSLNRVEVFKFAAKAISDGGVKYGTSDKYKGHTVIVEHTSTNPNSCVHIGNLRNTITGHFIANLHRSIGWNVEEWFFVNDLGGQIGLTFIGFQKIYSVVKPYLKIDLWLGVIYAICNTLENFQKHGWELKEASEIIKRDNNKEIEKLISKGMKHGRTADTAEKEKAIRDDIDTFADLSSRHPIVVETLVNELNTVDIHEESAAWNLRYESADPVAIKEYRKMVNLDLSGQQETLDVYGMHHDVFSFESELGWEGSNDRVFTILKDIPYYTPPTNKNAKGVPEGGFLNLSQFILDSGLPKGKGGYQMPYPNFYLIRPDGSTLYTYRDVVFSMKKCEKAERVYNVIASEQNLAQEKVQLGLRLLNPKAAERQYHLPYELVKLVGHRMSGRRALYVTADDVYSILKTAITEKMSSRTTNTPSSSSTSSSLSSSSSSPSDPSTTPSSSSSSSTSSSGSSFSFDEASTEHISHEIATAAIKYTLLACSMKTELVFDVKVATDPSQASAPFLLYNYARLCSILDKFQALVEGKGSKTVAAPVVVGALAVENAEEEEGVNAAKADEKGEEDFTAPPLCALEAVHWELLVKDEEWRLVMKYCLGLPTLIETLADPPIPPRPQLPQFQVHLMPEYLINFVRDFSSYYRSNRIIQKKKEAVDLMHARIWLVKICQQVLGNGLRLMGITPLERM